MQELVVFFDRIDARASVSKVRAVTVYEYGLP